MTQRILTTKLLGKLTYDKEKGILTDAVIPLDGKNVTLDFDVFEGITSEVVFQDIVTLTDQIPKLYINAKKTILEQFGENNIISFYFDYHIDNMPNEVLEITQVDTLKKFLVNF
ncbi:DNA-directed RNA polymerase [Listeria welshimeri]|uniref:DNA-directed RNA polymerase n=1 Tax=Listeria welshimeri TaxID=1643 RepID=UPI001E37EE19|nr:DNA-directed RNA polymerase [Listeria welshimeri]